DVAPGSHKITLQAAGKKDNDQTVEVAAFTGASVNATLEAGGVAAAEDPFATKDTGTPATTPTTTATTTATVTADTGGGGKREMTWVYVTGAAAIVGLGVGTFFGIKALGDKK